jgi:predicted RNA-binding Zn ribbon-like protein
MVKNNEIRDISLEGGRSCLDFVNTVHDRKSEPVQDYLFNALDLILWGEKVGILSKKSAEAIESAALAEEQKARKFFKEAIALRELLYRILYKVSRRERVGGADLNEFNDFLQKQFARLEIQTAKEGLQTGWDLPKTDFRWITAPIVMDAYELLLSDKLVRVKECPNCGWIFQDSTKNGKRKWCSMQACGSNVKALEWYHRNKAK